MTGNATRHSVLFIGAYIITAVLNYALGVALSWFFLPEQFGVLAVTQSILLLTALAVSSGFAWTSAQDLATHGVTEFTRRRFRAALVANTALGFLLSGGLWLAYRTGWLSLGDAYGPIIPLIGVTLVILSIRAVFNGAARGGFHFTPVAVNLVGEVVVKFVLGLALVGAGMGVQGMLIGFAAGAAAALVHSMWITRRLELWKGPGWFDWSALPATLPLFTGMLGTALMLNLDVIGLKLYTAPGASDQASGVYQAAVILARTPVFIAQALTIVLFSYAAGSRKNLAPNHYTKVAIRNWLRMLLPASLVLILAPNSVLSLFFPPAYHSASLLLQVSAAGCALLALTTLLVGVIQAQGNRRLPAVAASVAVAVQVATLALAVPRLGGLGASLSLITSGLVLLVLLAPAFTGIRETTSQEGRRTILTRPVRLLSYGTRLGLPLLALALPLLALPDGGRIQIIWKLGLSGLGYLAVLLMVHKREAEHAAPVEKAQLPIYRKLSQLVHVLIGG